MTNPFDGVLTDDLKELHCNAMAEVVRATAVPCELIFSSTKLTECPNCIYDPIGKKSSNKYKGGGPQPFSGVCPYCIGLGILTDESTETINLAPIYSKNHWCNKITVANTPDNLVATLSLTSTYAVLKRAKEVIINTDLYPNVRMRYERYSEPLPCGFGMACIIETIWRRIEN